MKICVLVYEAFAEFEMTFLGYLAQKEGCEIVTAAPDDTPEVNGLGGLKVRARLRLSDVNPEEYAALVIPGGKPETIIDRPEVSSFIRRFHAAGKLVSAICAAPVYLAKAGLLAGRSYTTSFGQNYGGLFDWSRKVDRPVVVDGNIVTGKGEEFIEFTYTVLEQLGIDMSSYREALVL